MFSPTASHLVFWNGLLKITHSKGRKETLNNERRPFWHTLNALGSMIRFV